MLLLPEIANVIRGEDAPAHFTAEEARFVTAQFVRGNLIRVALPYIDGRYKKGFEPTLEKLNEVDGVWALCFRKPAPGWRLIGRFGEMGTFVGLELADRRDLGRKGAMSYPTAITRAIERWQCLFAGIPPHVGTTIEDYAGGLCYDANAQ